MLDPQAYSVTFFNVYTTLRVVKPIRRKIARRSTMTTRWPRVTEQVRRNKRADDTSGLLNNELLPYGNDLRYSTPVKRLTSIVVAAASKRAFV